MPKQIRFNQTAAAALACGLLEDNGRIFFLKATDLQGVERIGLPCVFLQKGQDPVKKLAEVFLDQTGIEGHVQEVLFNTIYNAGSRRKKKTIPCLVFRVTAKVRQATLKSGFSGCVWLKLSDAREKKLFKTSEWLVNIYRT